MSSAESPPPLTPAPGSDGASAKRFNALLKNLPPALRTTLEEKLEDLEDDEREARLREFFEERKKALTAQAFMGEAHPHHVAIEKNPSEELAKFIETLEKGAHIVVGQGNAARVVSSEDNSSLCYKIMLPSDQIPPGTNRISREVDIQEDIVAMGEIAGVRAPRVVSFVETERTRAILMERLDAVSVRDVFIDKLEVVPEQFNAKVFLAALEQYVRALHERGYYHRDLHEGNVLIDRATGMPRVIDFGYSAQVFAEEDPYRAQYVENGRIEQLVLPSDEVKIESLRRRITPRKVVL